MNKKNEKSFEDALQRLEEIAQLLENEETPLEDSICLLYTSPSPRDRQKSRMPSSA